MKTMKTTIMKPNLKFLAIVASVGLFLQSCSSNDDEGAIELNAPVITNFEFGEGHHDEDGDDDHDHDSEEAYAFKGSDIHLAAEIAAEATVSSITLSIHADEVTAGEGEVAWDFEEEFLEGYHEEMEAEFHEHIDVPATAPTGEYHIIFTVEDEDGNTVAYETHIDVTA